MAERMRLDQNVVAKILHVGVPKSVTSSPSLDLDGIRSIEAATKSKRPHVIRKEVQRKMFDHILKQPLNDGKPYVMGISSIGNDAQAKYAAALIMERAVAAYDAARLTTLLLPPVWHTLTGSFQDYYRDNPKGKKPALMILSNVDSNSSEVKMEKLKDLLELYSDIPRIVTYTGADPVTLFTKRLKSPLQAALYLSKSSDGRTVEATMKKVWTL